MIKLNDDLLQELGLDSLPLEEKKRMLAHIYETLEMRVGMKLAQQMTDQQLDEFEQFIKNNDEAGALHWLETKFPHYKDVVSAEFEALKAEIRQIAPQILASSQSQMGSSIPQTSIPQTMPTQPPAFSGPQQQPAPSQWQQQPPTIPQQPQVSQQGWQPQPPGPQAGYGYAQPDPSAQQPQYGSPQQPQAFGVPPQQPTQPMGGQPQPYHPQNGSPQQPTPWQPPQDNQQQPPMAA